MSFEIVPTGGVIEEEVEFFDLDQTIPVQIQLVHHPFDLEWKLRKQLAQLT